MFAELRCLKVWPPWLALKNAFVVAILCHTGWFLKYVLFILFFFEESMNPDRMVLGQVT